MSLITDLLGGGVAGAVTGLIGNVVTSFTNLKAQKLKNEHDIAMVKAETEAMVAEATANIRITETRVQGDLEKADAETYMKGIELGNKPSLSSKNLELMFSKKWLVPFAGFLTFWLGLVDVLRGAMRPLLTLYMVIATSWITLTAYRIIEANREPIPIGQAVDIWNRVITTVIYLAVSCVTWWFADRRVGKFLYRLNDGNLREK